MNYKLLGISILTSAALLPTMATAVDFVPLVGIPGVSNPEDLGFNDYINAIYALSISIAALLAVVKLVIAGAKYMLSDIVTSKQDAKKDIEGALLGLLIVLAAVLILTTINSNITTFTLGSRAIIFEPQAGTPTPDTPPQNTYPAICDWRGNSASCNCDDGDTEVSRNGDVVWCQLAGGGAPDTSGGDSDTSGDPSASGTTYRLNCNNAECSSTPCPNGEIDGGVTASTGSGAPVFQRLCTIP